VIELSLTGVVVPCYFKGRLKTSNQAQVEAVNTMATVTCSGIVQEQHDRWEKALRHPFLQGCKDGSVAPEAFNTWLLQDHLWVREFLKFTEKVAEEAPDQDAPLLLGGVEALQDELAWMESHIDRRRLDGGLEPHQLTARYIKLLQEVQREPYAVLATAFWGIEYVYNESWASLGEVAPQFREFQQRWGSDEFSDYVKQLQAQADRALASAPQEQLDRAIDLVGRVVPELEVQFWQMALTPNS